MVACEVVVVAGTGTGLISSGGSSFRGNMTTPKEARRATVGV